MDAQMAKEFKDYGVLDCAGCGPLPDGLLRDARWRRLAMSRRILSRVLARLVGIFVLFHGGASGAQEGNFDSAFGNGGRLLVDVSVGHGDVAHRMVLLPGNKILMAGSCDHPQSAGSTDTYPEFCITRLLHDGSYDGTFGPGGVGYLRFDFFPGWLNSSDLKDMIVLHDGRIALFGTETAGGKMLLAVLLADGTALDANVGGGNGYLELQFANANSAPASIVQQSDDKILIAGSAMGINGNADFAVARLLKDLSGFDTSFGSGGSQLVAFDLGGPGGDDTDTCLAVRLQSSGKIVLAGYANSAAMTGFTPAIALARLNADGTRDTTFGTSGDGRLHYVIQTIAVATDARIDAGDRIVLGGAAANTTAQWFVDRLTPDGTRDPAFNGGNPQAFPVPPGNAGGSVARLALANDGMFAIGISPRTSDALTNYFVVARLNWNGSLDARFGNGGKSYGSFTATSDLDSSGVDIAVGNGGLMIAGTQTQTGPDLKFAIGRLQYDQIFSFGFE
jgi:uncharacterized delta-60 repeat protein